MSDIIVTIPDSNSIIPESAPASSVVVTFPASNSVVTTVIDRGVLYGIQGVNGVGVPSGGSTGQVLKKVSGANYDTTWADNNNSVTSVNGKTGVVVLVKSDVGLGNVDNTSDVNKPISTATQTALDTKASTTALNAHITDLNNPHNVTKTQIGLGNVDNTSDVNKPISTSTQTALNAKQDSIGYTPANAARTLTINGVTYDLTANRSWSVGDLVSTGAYSNPSWLIALAWGKITGTPTTIAGYGITDAVSTAGSYANPTWLTSLAWGKITSTPTTLSGYGITDGVSTSGSYSNPSWITNLAFSKITGYSVPTLDQVTTAGNTTTNGINIGSLTVGTNKLVVFPTTGNVGINTLVDAGYELDVLGGDVRLNGVRIGLGNGSQSANMAVGFEALNANATGIGITAIGYQALKNGTVSYNTAIGYQSQINGGGQNNTSVGYLTLTAQIFGSSANTAIGHTALRYLVSGSNNTAVGSDAQQTVTSGSDNTSVGVTSLYFNTSGSRNSAFGVGALYSFTGNESVAFGYNAASNLTTPVGIIAIGTYALNSATTSPQNTAVGYQSQRYGNNATGQNTSVGYNTFSNASFNGSRNTAVGALAGVALTTGNTNAFFGYLAGTAATSSSNNTLIGSSAGSTLSAGSNNTLVGALTVTTGSSNAILGTGGSASTFSACVVLGREGTATGSNQFVVGSTTYPAGTVTAAVAPVINEYWTVKINGVDKKIALIA